MRNSVSLRSFAKLDNFSLISKLDSLKRFEKLDKPKKIQTRQVTKNLILDKKNLILDNF